MYMYNGTYVLLCVYVCIYIYIYIYGFCPIPPPLLFDQPAIYKTSWRAGETIALVYNYAKTHMKTRCCYCMLYYCSDIHKNMLLLLYVCCITTLIFGSMLSLFPVCLNIIIVFASVLK